MSPAKAGEPSREVYLADRAAWRRWLEQHHAEGRGTWLIYNKGPDRRLTYEDIVEEALCFGWVDSRPGTVSPTQAKLYIAPRKATSSWSAKNKARAERLIATGRMKPAGRAAVEAAKANGRWNALDEVEMLTEPSDLATALDSMPDARRYWDGFPRSTRRAILEWIGAAKQPETRARRIATTVAEAAENRRANQWRQPKRPRE